MAINVGKRLQVFQRDGFRCKLCGSSGNLTIDHIVPRSNGGSDDKENLRTLCRTCNINRGNYNPTLWERLTSFIFTRKNAHVLKGQMITEMSARDATLKVQMQEEVNKLLQRFEARVKEVVRVTIMESSVQTMTKMTGIENSLNAYSKRSEEREEYLKKIIFLVCERLKEMES